MKRLVFLILTVVLFLPTSAMAQSDCTAPYCGTVPIMEVEIGGDLATASYFQFDSVGPFSLRVRAAPVPGYENLSYKYFEFDPGQYATYNFLLYLFPGITEWRGTLILDWASYEGHVSIEHYSYAYDNSDPWSEGSRYRIFQQFIERGCYSVPKPHGTAIDFTFYNESETMAQTVEIDDEIYIVPYSRLGDERTVVVSLMNNEETFSIRVCTGAERPPSPAGIDYDLPLYFAARFTSGDRSSIYSEAWVDN